ncbi:MAG TPA: SDR family NAD(P)-dependent oxidoreductase, partial [Armatimonadota bacterium]|nr:SDR family NAD(P)-dependent oxidoreductase [Armatimonadota bacterium]
MQGLVLGEWEAAECQPGATAEVIPQEPSETAELTALEQQEEATAGTVMLTPVWDAVAPALGTRWPESAKGLVIIGGTGEQRDGVKRRYPQAQVLKLGPQESIAAITKKVKEQGEIAQILWLAPNHSQPSVAGEELIAAQNRGVLQIFRLVKALLGQGYGGRKLGWTVVTVGAQAKDRNERLNPSHASIHGLMGSLAKEYPHWQVRLVDLGVGDTLPVDELFGLPADPQGDAWLYRNGEYYRQKLIPCRYPAPGESRYRTGGVYVVIGGAGGIGEVWSEYLINAYQARIVWIGRRPMDEAIQTKIERLGAQGPAPVYITADAQDLPALQNAYATIKAQYGQIHGVIHSAIVLFDKSLANMEEERFAAGLRAKVDVSVRLAQVFAGEPLDFVLFFSSLQSFTKAPGQSNYAAGCTFKDAFAHQLGLEWGCPVKVMNWGYWGKVGIVATQAYQERMAQAGIGSLEPPEAMAALEMLLGGELTQIGFMKVTQPREETPAEERLTLYPPVPALLIPETPNRIAANLALKQTAPPEMEAALQAAKEQLAPALEATMVKLLWGQLQRLGMFTQKETTVTELKSRSGLIATYDRWLEETLAELVRRQYLKRDGERCRSADPTVTDLDSVWQEWEQQKVAWLAHPDLKPQVTLSEAMLRALPEILTGKTPATDIMFRNASLELVGGVYKENQTADRFTEVVVATVVTLIEERLNQEPTALIRIIEIGAGTGGTSTMVLQSLKPYREQIEEYCYTDISKAFLMHAEQTYGPENPYLKAQLFNVTQPLASQGIAAGGYDIAIAANVLHATPNIRETLRNAKATLKTNGVLIVNEISGNSLFAHLSFGLLKGWWLYEDAHLRIPGCPGMDPATWKAVLESEGFHSVSFPAEAAHGLGSQIIVAASDGVVRQKQAPRETAQPKTPGAVKPQTRVDPKTGAVRSGVNPKSVPAFAGTAAMANHKNGKAADAIRGMEVTTQMAEDYVKETITEKLSASLKVAINQIDGDESFADYGLDSITGIGLVQAVNISLELELTTTDLFDYSSVNQLAKYILSRYKAQVIQVIHQNEMKQKAAPGKIPEVSLDPQPENTAIQQAEPAERRGTEITPVPKTARELPSILTRRSRMARFFPPGNAPTYGAAVAKEPIAIIGISGRYAPTENVNQLWEHLAQGRDLVGEIQRWKLPQSYLEDHQSCKRGSFIENIAAFDPFFFNISGVEAAYMDPQQRLFLEEAWKALEDAGYAGTKDGMVCGVYLGYNGGDYGQL